MHKNLISICFKFKFTFLKHIILSDFTFQNINNRKLIKLCIKPHTYAFKDSDEFVSNIVRFFSILNTCVNIIMFGKELCDASKYYKLLL